MLVGRNADRQTRAVRRASSNPETCPTTLLTSGGGEIGRTAVHESARLWVKTAYGYEPVLFETRNRCGAQVIVQGQTFRDYGFRGACRYKADLIRGYWKATTALRPDTI
jgi:cobyric acid synthase